MKYRENYGYASYGKYEGLHVRKSRWVFVKDKKTRTQVSLEKQADQILSAAYRQEREARIEKIWNEQKSRMRDYLDDRRNSSKWGGLVVALSRADAIMIPDGTHGFYGVALCRRVRSMLGTFRETKCSKFSIRIKGNAIFISRAECWVTDNELTNVDGRNPWHST